MSAPSLEFLGWQRHVDTAAPALPPHLTFEGNDAQDFLRTWIASSTHDDVQSRKLDSSIVDNVGFPREAYEALALLDEATRSGVRETIRRVFLPVDPDNKLTLLLPIDVLMQIIRDANTTQFFAEQEFLNSDTITKVARTLTLHPQWFVNPDITALHHAYSLCFALMVVQRTPRFLETHKRLMSTHRAMLIQTWNNRHGRPPRTPRQEHRIRKSSFN